MRGYLVIVLSVVGALVCAPAAAAAPGWGPEDTISPYGWGEPSAAVDSKGNAVVAFSGDFLAVSTRAAGNHFSTPVGLFSASEAKAGIAEDGWAAVAGRGPATTPSHGGQYLVSLRPPGGQFRAPVALGVTESPGHVWNFAVGPDGTMALAYPAGGGFAIHVRKPGQESFSPAQVVPSDWQIYLDPPRIVIDGTGRVLVFWATFGRTIQYAERGPADAEFSHHLFADPADLYGQYGQYVAISPSGVLAVTQHEGSAAGRDERDVLIIRQPGQTAGEATRTVLPADFTPRAMSVNDAGTVAMAGWDPRPSAPFQPIEVLTRDADDTITRAAVPSISGHKPRNVRLGVDAEGDSVLMWREGPLYHPFVPVFWEDRLVTGELKHGATAVTGVATRAVPAVDEAALAVAPSGVAVAAWEQSSAARLGPETSPICAKAAVREESRPAAVAGSCASARAPTTFPGYVPPRAPSTGAAGPGAPVVRFSGSTHQTLSGPAVTVMAACTTACRLAASGSINVGKAAATYRLKGTRTKLLPARRRVKLKLSLSRKSYRAVRRALRKGSRVTSTIRVTATDRQGARKSATRRLRLRYRG